MAKRREEDKKAMITEYIGKIIEAFKKKPDMMAGVGLAIMVGSAMIGWTITMYMGGAMALFGYMIGRSRRKKKAK